MFPLRIISNEQKYCSVTWANMNEHSMQRTNWHHYHCFVMLVMQQSMSFHENF